MLSKNDTKYIKSLQNKKYRKNEHAFLVEGIKIVRELILSRYEIVVIYCTQPCYEELKNLLERRNLRPVVVSETALTELGTIENNTSALAIAKMPVESQISTLGKLTLALDGLNDPGNFGTILRIADWYGVQQLVCSNDCVDLYNPKVLNASKGSFMRVQVVYMDLRDFLSENKDVDIYAAAMVGQSLYDTALTKPSILLMGNEANGISPQIASFATRHITIPRIGLAESLNVGVATGIVLDRLLGK